MKRKLKKIQTHDAVAISHDIHMKIAEARLELRRKYDVKLDMQDIADVILENGFEVFDLADLFGIDKSKYKSIDTGNGDYIRLIDADEVI